MRTGMVHWGIKGKGGKETYHAFDRSGFAEGALVPPDHVLDFFAVDHGVVVRCLAFVRTACVRGGLCEVLPVDLS